MFLADRRQTILIKTPHSAVLPFSKLFFSSFAYLSMLHGKPERLRERARRRRQRKRLRRLVCGLFRPGGPSGRPRPVKPGE